jgi:elongation factor Ts
LALVELACETDFVARNTDFINVGTKIAETALQQKASGPNEGLEARVKEIASLIKENIALKRVAYFSAGMNETLHTYLHGEGRIGVVVSSGQMTRLPSRMKRSLHLCTILPSM